MTISSVVSRNDYTGDGTTTVFPYTYHIDAQTDLLVTVATSGTESTKVITTDYTVSGVGAVAGGNVTFVIAPALNDAITIRRVPPNTQIVDIRNQGRYAPEEIETGLDKLAKKIQNLQDEVNRCLQLRETEAGTVAKTQLPTATDRANMALLFDASGNPVAGTLGTTALTVSAFMQTVLDDATAAAARTTLVADGLFKGVTQTSTTPYTVLSTDQTIFIDATAGAKTVNLPAVASSAGQRIVIKKVDSSLNAVTVDGNGAETVDGATTTTLNTQYESIEIVCTGTAWLLVDRTIPSVWTTYTPTGAWVANTTFTGRWRRVKDSMECQIHVALTGAPTSATFTASIPSGGYAIDAAKLAGSGSGNSVLGAALAFDTGTAQYVGTTAYNDTTTVLVFSPTVWTQAVPFTFGNTDAVNLRFTVPITGWKG